MQCIEDHPEVPNSVTSIRESAFSGCRALTQVEIPDSVTSIALRKQLLFHAASLKRSLLLGTVKPCTVGSCFPPFKAGAHTQSLGHLLGAGVGFLLYPSLIIKVAPPQLCSKTAAACRGWKFLDQAVRRMCATLAIPSGSAFH